MSMIIMNDNINIYELYIAHFENDREMQESMRKEKEEAQRLLGWGLDYAFSLFVPIRFRTLNKSG